MSNTPNEQIDYFKKYIEYLFGWRHYRKVRVSLFSEIDELVDLVFPYGKDKFALEGDFRYVQSILKGKDFYSQRDLRDLLNTLRFLLHDIVIYGKGYIGVDYINESGSLIIGSMNRLDPNTISVTKNNKIRQSYSLFWYLISPQVLKKTP